MKKQLVTFRFSDAASGSGFGYGSVPNLAVEVHDETLALAARGTLKGGVELAPGRDYFISATLPDGTRITKHAKIEPKTTVVEFPDPLRQSFIGQQSSQYRISLEQNLTLWNCKRVLPRKMLTKLDVPCRAARPPP